MTKTKKIFETLAPAPESTSHIKLNKQYDLFIAILLMANFIIEQTYNYYNGLWNIQQNIPVILGVLTVNTQKQALDRANGKYGNKGKECAEAALRMIEVKNELKSKSKK